MKVKGMVSFLLAATLISGVVLTGCGGSKESTSVSSNSSAQSAQTSTSAESTKADVALIEADKIFLFQSKVEIVDQLEALAKDYQKEKGIELEVQGTTGDDYFQQLKIKLANNQGPTVFSLAPGAESAQMTSYLEDLSGLSFIDKIAKGMANVIDNKVVGIPYTVEGFGVVYNKKMIDAATIKDYDSFVNMLKDQKAKGISGFSLSSPSYFLIGHILNTPFALQKNPNEFIGDLTAGKVKMADTPEFQEFAKFYAAIRDYANNPLKDNYDKQIGDFATGKSAAIHQGNWCSGMFTDFKEKVDMGMMPLPIAGNDKIAVSVPTAWYVNSMASEAEKKAGKGFLEWLYSSDTGKKYLMDEFKFIPVVSGMENANLDVLSKDVQKYTAEGKTISWPMSNWPAGIVDVHFVPVAQKFFTSKMTPEEFLKEMDEAWVKASSKK